MAEELEDRASLANGAVMVSSGINAVIIRMRLLLGTCRAVVDMQK